MFLRKAKGYRSKQSGSYGHSNSLAFGKAADRYKLSAMGPKTDNFSSNDRGNNSEENILSPCPNNSIIKSVTYTVQVDDDAESASSKKENMPRPVVM